MPLIIFSEQKHVKKIFDGSKAQTTRLRGKRVIKKGDTLYNYFKSRMRKGTCKNCINRICLNSKYYTDEILSEIKKDEVCPQWFNFFGSAFVTYAEPIDFYLLSNYALEEWAIADGFESFSEADQWFTKVHGKNWMDKDWVLIQFEGTWVK